ncbi:hypothetical protein [Rhodococcus olei]
MQAMWTNRSARRAPEAVGQTSAGGFTSGRSSTQISGREKLIELPLICVDAGELVQIDRIETVGRGSNR